MKKFIILFFTLALALPAYSYVPKFWTISSMLARTRDNSPLKVTQDVIIKDNETGGTLAVRETLYVKNGDLIKIKVQGKNLLANQVRTSFIYKSGKKIYNNAGTISSSSIPTGFYSPLLYTKSATGFRKYLNLHGYLPAEGLVEPKATIISKRVTSIPESFIHLSRTNGKISYAVTKKLSTPQSISPTVWINQDGFHLGKVRIDENSVISLNNYKEFGKKNWHPQKQTIKWKDYTYEIKTISVKSISSSQVNKELSTNSIRNDGDLTNFNNPALETFYTIFR